MTLTNQKCTPCEGGADKISDEKAAELTSHIPDWETIHVDGEARLQRVFDFSDFQSALAFTQRVGDIAEAEGHHPALLTEWGKVTVTWWTHAINGLHENDFIMAAKTDEL
ncbi:MAG: 4a-hydroxytetrahydrobiopterin dehydratase [Elainellaceae cyanobacterium]